MGKKDECWKYTEYFPRRTKFETKCMFCKEINSGGNYRFKFHIVGIPRHDITVCTKQTAEVKRTCLVALEKFEQEKIKKKRQLQGIRAIGSHAPTAASTSASDSAFVGCVGEGSSRPPFRPSVGAPASADASASASASASRSYSHTESSSLLQPRVRKNRLNSYFVPRTTPGSQPTLEGMGLNKEIHDAARKETCKFWAPYWQNMIDAVAICGLGFKAPIDAKLSGYLLDEIVRCMDCKEAGHTKGSCPKKAFCDIYQIARHSTKEYPYNLRARNQQVLSTQEQPSTSGTGGQQNVASSGSYRNN